MGFPAFIKVRISQASSVDISRRNLGAPGIAAANVRQGISMLYRTSSLIASSEIVRKE